MKKKILAVLLTLMTAFGVLPSVVLQNSNQSIKALAATVITTRSSQSYIDNYYSTISPTATGESLKNSLASLLKSERVSSFSYNSLQSSAFPYTDVDPLRPNEGYITSFYSGKTVKGYSGMNKEHTWPDSHGGGKIDNDPHVIRPTLTSENSARGNMYYAQAPNAGWDPASFNNPKYRGIAARIIFYGATIGASSGLIIEDVGRGQASGTGNRMGKLGDLLKWNLEYPIDQTEIIRNETLDISLNYNRNPFIDDPSLACKIWGNTNANTQSICSVSNVEPTSITLTPSSATVNVGSTQTLTVNVSPTGAASTVTWSSSNNNIATVSNGVVTPVSTGQVTITARSTVNTSLYATSLITVTNTAVSVTGVSINQSNQTLNIGQNVQMSATISPANATNKNLTWSSSTSGVASVNSSGLVSANSAGTATITVTTSDGGFSDAITITVTSVPTPNPNLEFTFSNSGNPSWNHISGFGAYFGTGYGISTASSGSAGGTLKSNKIVENVPVGSTFTFSIAAVTNDTSNKAVITIYGLDYSGNRISGITGNYTTPSNSSSTLSVQNTFARSNPGTIVLPSSQTKKIYSFELVVGTASSRTLLVDVNITYTAGSSEVQALAFANFVNLDQGLGAQGTCLTTLNLLESEYQLLNAEAKALFMTSSGTSYVQARERLNYLATWVNRPPLDYLSINNQVTTSSNINAIVYIALFSMLTIISYYYLKKRHLKD